VEVVLKINSKFCEPIHCFLALEISIPVVSKIKTKLHINKDKQWERKRVAVSAKSTQLKKSFKKDI
jgi:hypothetical protein